jgi:4-amino-4-deoxy-L-arabinose transferase-like glycosyltransferase
VLATPLLLSAFTHLWNPIGFPSIHPDEGTYMRRAMHVLEGLGPQELSNLNSKQVTIYDQQYNGDVFLFDHPYFGQFFLAGALGIIGYPFGLGNAPEDKDSIETLYIIPRIFLGLLAVVDTLLVFKIAESKYNRKIAFVAAVLFSVMPFGWLLRRIFLDNLLLPLLLSSILFAVYVRNHQNVRTIGSNQNNNTKKQIVLALISGVFLGLSIFTKIPVFTFIPLIAFLIYTNSGKNIKVLGLWIIPVILIPLLWPAFSISVGQFNYWIDGVARQAGERDDKPLIDSLITFFGIDPVFLALGMAGLIYAAIRRDFMILLWVIPYLIFFYFISFTSIVYLVAMIPPLCIAAGRMIVEISSKIKTRMLDKIVLLSVFSVFVIFGLITTTLLVTINLNSSFFEVYALVAKYLPTGSEKSDGEKTTTLLGRYSAKSYVWISRFVYQKEFDFVRDDSLTFYYNEGRLPTPNDKILLIVDGIMLDNVMADNREDLSSQWLKTYYNNTTTIEKFKDDNPRYDRNTYPYNSLLQSRGIGDIEVRANY